MPRELFGEVVDPTPRLGSRSKFVVPLSIAAHAVLAAAAVIVPLMAVDVLPAPHSTLGVFKVAPGMPEPPPPPPAAGSAPSATPAAVNTAAPREADVGITPEAATTTAALAGPGVAGGLPDGVMGGLGVVAAPPLLPPSPPEVTGPVPVGGRIKPPTKVRHVPPVYPAMAQQARVEGIVIIEAVIGVDGRVKEARVLRSKPLLDDAALGAVRQWVFSPTLLNGVPVPVIMTVTVNFTLK